MQPIRRSVLVKNTLARASFGFLVLLVSILFAGGSASALPKVGGSRPSIKLVDGWDRTLDLSKLDRPLLMFYEDEDSGSQNQTLKDQLIELEKSQQYRKVVTHIVVADTSAYDYWPAKGIAKGELRKWSERLGITVYGDFSGQAKQKLDVDAGQSNVFLYSKDAKVLFARSGTLPAKQRTEVLDALRSQVTKAASACAEKKDKKDRCESEGPFLSNVAFAAPPASSLLVLPDAPWLW